MFTLTPSIKIHEGVGPLKEAVQRLQENPALSIWAQDMSNKNYTRTWKRFITGTFRDIITLNQYVVQPNVYEELLEKRASRLYMDVEIEQHQTINMENVRKNLDALKLSNEFETLYKLEATKEVNESFACDFKRLLLQKMGKFVSDHLSQEYQSEKVIVLSACRKTKLSFHIIYSDLIFDRHNTSMVFFLWEFRQYFKDQILMELNNSNKNFSTETLIRSLCLNSHPQGTFNSP